MFERMELRGGLHPYQASIVERVGSRGAHIVLSEGAESTVVGLEAIRRLRRRAVVFAPSVAAQVRWQQELSRFANPVAVAQLSTLDARVTAPITLLSQHHLVSAEAAAALMSDLAEERWAAELVTTGEAPNQRDAHARLASHKAHNPRKFARTLARRQARLTAGLLQTPTPDLERRLQPATRRLIDALVIRGLRTIVLDACDQLSDGWVVVLRHLVHRITAAHGLPTMIGLSAMPHSVPGVHRHCRRLIDGPEVEAPAPALVHSGAIAPYRDLVHFVLPSAQERALLDELGASSRTRQSVRACERLLCRSEEKVRATAEILAREHAARPQRLQAVVLTEHEELEAGNAAQVFGAFLADERMQALGPLLVTRRGLVVEASRAEDLSARCWAFLGHLDLKARCWREESGLPGATAVVLEGPDCTTRTAAMLAAQAMADGATRCLIGGADGALAEGWDAVELDTLVDLTSRPGVSAARLRGRALRLDESTPGKVAHVWHVVAYRPLYPWTDLDVRRFVQRQKDRWGLRLTGEDGRVVRGAAAIDDALASGAVGAVDYQAVNDRCFAEITDREASRQRWAPRSPATAVTVAVVDLAEVARPEPLRAVLPRLRVPLLLTGLLIALLAVTDGAVLGRQVASGLRVASQLATLLTAALLGASVRHATRVLRVALGSAEARLAARGRTVLDALRDSGQINLHLHSDAVHVRRAGRRRCEVGLEGASKRDTEVFATALAETLVPAPGQRYLVDAGSYRLPVPTALSRDPELFLLHWRWYGGGGRLVQTNGRLRPRPRRGLGAFPVEVWDAERVRDPGRRWSKSFTELAAAVRQALQPSGEPASASASSTNP